MTAEAIDMESDFGRHIRQCRVTDCETCRIFSRMIVRCSKCEKYDYDQAMIRTRLTYECMACAPKRAPRK